MKRNPLLWWSAAFCTGLVFWVVIATAVAGACSSPDRYHLGASRGRGDLEGPNGGSWDSESTGFELGVSGDLLGGQKSRDREPGIEVLIGEIRALRADIAAMTKQPEDNGFPLEEVLGGVGLLAAAGGGVYTHRRYKARRSAT